MIDLIKRAWSFLTEEIRESYTEFRAMETCMIEHMSRDEAEKTIWEIWESRLNRSK